MGANGWWLTPTTPPTEIPTLPSGSEQPQATVTVTVDRTATTTATVTQTPAATRVTQTVTVTPSATKTVRVTHTPPLPRITKTEYRTHYVTPPPVPSSGSTERLDEGLQMPTIAPQVSPVSSPPPIVIQIPRERHVSDDTSGDIMWTLAVFAVVIVCVAVVFVVGRLFRDKR